MRNKPRPLSWLFLPAVLALAACGGSGGGDPSSPGTSSSGGGSSSSSGGGTTITVALEDACGISGFGTAMLDAVNAARATARYCGADYFPAVAPLAWNAQLAQAAAGHSHDMADNDYSSHTGLDGRSAKDRIDATGYVGSYWGENIYGGPGSVDAAMTGWLASAGHCANIMNSHFEDFGAACASNASSTYGNYWTQNFAAPR
jgi:uncharacterized protein YkwD